MYTAYKLSDASRAALMLRFLPKYTNWIGHHVTVEFGVPAGTPPPETAKLRVVGYVDSGDGIETLVVSIDGKKERADGKTYHVTWSLDSSKYKPVDSNQLLLDKKYTVILPEEIHATPVVLN